MVRSHPVSLTMVRSENMMKRLLLILFAACIVTSTSGCAGEPEASYVVQAVSNQARTLFIVQLRQAGGGLGSNHCFDTVLIVPAAMLEGGIYPVRNTIYAGTCHLIRSPNDPSVLYNGPLVSWFSDSEVTLSDGDKSKRVNVSSIRVN